MRPVDPDLQISLTPQNFNILMFAMPIVYLPLNCSEDHHVLACASLLEPNLESILNETASQVQEDVAGSHSLPTPFSKLAPYHRKLSSAGQKSRFLQRWSRNSLGSPPSYHISPFALLREIRRCTLVRSDFCDWESRLVRDASVRVGLVGDRHV